MHNLTRALNIKTMQTKTVATRYGKFTIFNEDELVGQSLSAYGEYSEGEVEVFRKVLRPGDTAIDVGANIGAFTIPMAKLVGGDGHVIAFEPSPANLDLLEQNVEQNGFGPLNIGNVTIKPYVASDKEGTFKVDKRQMLFAYCYPEAGVVDFEVESITIDSLNLPKVKLIKVNVNGHELQVLRGAAETIKRCKPIIYIENELNAKREAMVAWLIDHGYRLFWHRPYMYNADNWRGNTKTFTAR